MPITTSVDNANELFDSNVRFIMPPFQRRYVWDQEAQWEPLWENVVELADESMAAAHSTQLEPHFLGALVLHQKSNEPKEPLRREVIDGQQRLTTIQLLIDAAELVFRELAPEHSEDLGELISNTKTKLDPDHRFKVWPTRHDRDAFKAAMDDNAESSRSEGSRIVQAHRFFESQVRQWLEEAGCEDEKDARCQALVKVISQRLNFVVINVDAEQAANSIFETLNARGTPLLAWDLVKNLIYEQAGDDPDFEDWFEEYLLKFDDDWWQLESGVGRNQASNVDSFLVHFLTLRTKREVTGHNANRRFRSFSRYVSDGDKVGEKGIKGIGTDLARIGDTFEEIMNRESVSNHGRFLYHWKIGGHGVWSPVVLWLFSNGLPSQELDVATSVLDSYLGRRLVIQASTKDYSELARGLLSKLDDAGPGNAGTATLDYLSERGNSVQTLAWPSDDEVRHTLVEMPFYRRLTVPRARMVLELVERQMSLEAKVAQPGEVYPDYWIEHVLPQKWKSWPKPISGSDEESPVERRERLLQTLGNLTLTGSKLGIKLKNRPWEEKRPILEEHSKLYLSNGLVRHTEQWNEDAIVRRGREMADTLLRAWPGPDKF